MFFPSQHKSSTFFKRETFSGIIEAAESQLPPFSVLNTACAATQRVFPTEAARNKVPELVCLGGKYWCIWRKRKSVNCRILHLTCFRPSSEPAHQFRWGIFAIFDQNDCLLQQHTRTSGSEIGYFYEMQTIFPSTGCVLACNSSIKPIKLDKQQEAKEDYRSGRYSPVQRGFWGLQPASLTGCVLEV